MMAALVTPECIGCGQRPYQILADGEQAFCGNADCRVICWDATRTLNENLDDCSFIDLSGRES